MSKLTLARRLILARQHADIDNPQILAESVSRVTGRKLTAAQVIALETGRAQRSGRIIEIALVCGVRPDWLAMGEGPMIEGGLVTEVTSSDDLSDAELDLIYVWRHIPIDTRDAVMHILTQMAKPMMPGYRALEEHFEAQNARRQS